MGVRSNRLPLQDPLQDPLQGVLRVNLGSRNARYKDFDNTGCGDSGRPADADGWAGPFPGDRGRYSDLRIGPK